MDMLMQTKTIAAGLPGLRKALRGLTGMASAFAMVRKPDPVGYFL